ncbi:TadE/TadG family type IV pilus assembly protein [Phenylobacterium sp.]|uniref:TadE/TadG family type IV pilus assembly protein n=1 Tax=Phenylobacterium sp. TaxID=1871053 RepID=UPI00301C07C8
MPSRLRTFAMFRRDLSGATAVEFAFVAPVLIFALFSLIEIGMLGMMTSGVDSAVFEASRRIRTGRDDAANSTAAFKDQICARLGGDIGRCRDRLTTSVQRFSRFADANAVAAQQPDDSFNKGAAGDIIIVKANYRWPLMTPFLATSNGRTGPLEVTIASRAAFKNEPFE